MLKALNAMSGRLRPVAYQDEEQSILRWGFLLTAFLVLVGCIIGLSIHRAEKRGLNSHLQYETTSQSVLALGVRPEVRDLDCKCRVDSVSLYEINSVMLLRNQTPFDFATWAGDFVSRCSSLAPTSSPIAAEWSQTCFWIARHVVCQTFRLYLPSISTMARFQDAMQMSWRRNCVSMVAEAWHLWHKLQLLLEIAFRGITAPDGSALWGANSSSATWSARKDLETAVDASVFQIYPSFTVLSDPAALCSGPLPKMDWDGLYSALFDLCAKKYDSINRQITASEDGEPEPGSVLCQWVQLESDFDVSLWVIAIMGTLFTVTIMATATGYQLTRRIPIFRKLDGDQEKPPA